MRFAIAGAISSLVYTIVFLPFAWYVTGERLAVIAVVPAFFAAATVGYVLHSNWSFKGHGTRDNPRARQVKFLIVQALGMVLNLAFTWIITGPLFHGPAWASLIPCFLVTPFATFALNRQLVFK
ncbi:GtrA family protein [Sphingomonas oligophenolica]|nr:GtrA family protein [Sphingomonas oligophenolica]